MANMGKYASITRLMGEDDGFLSEREAARKSASVVRNLMNDIGIPAGLAALGVSGDLSEVMALVNRPGMDASNPRPTGSAAFEILVKGSLSPAMSYWEVGGILTPRLIDHGQASNLS